jgi:WD40 repeat protein/tRNA A-37 threonylcarbamoyl transferase component Bud32/energy-coupling factor transporter ATP-binding protein EcfA2
MSELTGQNLGRYQIVSLLGQGGMAEVYKAYQPGLDRYVAVKVLHKHLAEEVGFVGRFEREAASVARLRHPNIVQVIDFDRQDDQYYMVMEFIDGPTLRGQGEERGEPYPPDEAAYLVSGVAGGLDYAHGRGVVHRDVKPGNIMFTGEGQVVLTDFGIAHIVGTTLYTESGGMLGTPAYMAPEQGRGEMGDARSDIYSLGVVLYEILTGRLPYDADTPLGMIQLHIEGQPPPPRTINADIPEDVDTVILKAMAVDPEMRYQRAGEMTGALLDAVGLRAEGAGVYPGVREVVIEEEEEAVERPLPPCPYRGLFAFREEDAPYFYGREAFTDRLVAAVEEKSLVGVVGPSGSGKSSVVFAGLLPHLRQAAGLRGAEGRAWAIAVCRPGHSPFYSLATALVPQLEGEVSDTARLVGTQKTAVALRKGEVSLVKLSQDILEDNPQYGRLLLVVDQFEELFTLCQDDDERRRFMDVLLAGIETDSPIRLVLTIRADFLNQSYSYRNLADALQDADLILGPMTRGELSQAVENPARKQGVAFEEGLVERILDDVGDEPGNLPLLEFALTQLWEQQGSGQLSHEAYEAIGGVEGALARYADQVFAELEQSQRVQARHVFTQMVMPGEGTQDTRRLAQHDELGEEDWVLVQELADARLVVTNLDLISEAETVEVVHEALIQSWGQLRGWMMEDRAFRTWQERLRAAMRGWEASDRDEGALLRGGPLVEAESWLEERQTELSELEKTYIQESIVLREHQQAVRDRRRRYTIIGLSAGLIITLVLALVAFQQRQSAQTQAGILLASQAESELEDGNTDRAILLALEALENYPYTPQAEHALGQAVTYNRALGFYEGHTAAVTGADWSSDGSRIATSSTDNSVHIWDPSTGETITEINLPEGITGNIFDWGLAVKWSYDDRYLLTISGDRFLLGSQDYDLILWDAETGEQVATQEVQNATPPDAGDSPSWFYHYTTGAGAAFAGDGRLATLGGDNTTLVWDPMLGDLQLVLSGHTAAINGVDWSPDFTLLATASEDGTARVWDAERGDELMQLVGHEGGINQVAWSPDGSLLATAGDDGEVRFWDADSGESLTAIQVVPSSGNVKVDELVVYSLAWSPDSDYLATGSGDGYIRVWDVESGELITEMKGHEKFVTYLAWSPVDDRLVSAGAGGKARVWNTAPDNMVLSLPYGNISLADWSPDGQYIALGVGPGWDKSDQGLIAVWDMNTGQPLFETHVDKDATFTWMAGYSPDGEYILAKTILNWPETSDANKYYVLDSQNGEIVRMLESGKDIILLIPGWSPDGQLVGGGDWEGTIYFWEVSSGELVRTQDCLSWGHMVQWSPDGRKIAMLCLDFSEEVGIIQVLDAETYELLVTIDGDLTNGCFQYFHWSPDSTRIVAGCGSDETGTTTNPIYIYDADSGEELLKIVRHTGAVSGVGWSPDSKRVVSGSTDDTTRIWDAETGAELLTLSTPGDWYVIPEWSPDGQYLRVDIDGNFPGRNGVWRVWQTKEELIDYAKECCVFRELTAEEREQFGLPER